MAEVIVTSTVRGYRTGIDIALKMSRLDVEATSIKLSVLAYLMQVRQIDVWRLGFGK